jgi:glycosyltransferase involved in cell wall biosynthesis
MIRHTLLFVSSRFLFPVDSGGKIRTTQILRGLKGGRFRIWLASPAPPGWERHHGEEVRSICDRFISWPERARNAWFQVRRLAALSSRLPVPVATDRSNRGRRVIVEALATRPPDILVVDFPHAAVLIPMSIGIPSVMFTHNVESEIFMRHAAVEKRPLRRAIWHRQRAKMCRYERETLRRFDRIVAVSERDRAFFADRYGLLNTSVIPTGVDLEYFFYSDLVPSEEVVFTGSMDWLANQDGIAYFMDEVWPLVIAKRPSARMTVVGRSPPSALIERAAARGYRWNFTGFVEDVRDYMQRAGAYVIPIRVGGGTRLKVFEAMASGCPVVSTSVGVEGLPVVPGMHYLRADSSQEMADSICRLLGSHSDALRLARAARDLMERKFSFRVAAEAFAEICAKTLETGSSPAAPSLPVTEPAR